MSVIDICLLIATLLFGVVIVWQGVKLVKAIKAKKAKRKENADAIEDVSLEDKKGE